MFSLFKRDRRVENPLVVDLHSHLLPQLDDGANSMEESLRLIKELKSLGYKKLITTPHTMIDSYNNKKSTILRKLDEVKEALFKENIDIEIEASSEYYLDEGFLDIIRKNEIIAISKEYILFETPHLREPFNLKEIIYEIKLKGYKPILAHPERYRYIKNLEKEYKRLRDLGVYFQINGNSLKGYYGKNSYKRAMFLLNSGWIDFIGSDTHHQRHIDSLKSLFEDKSLWKKILKRNNILNSKLIGD